jgi:hypothetical protein
MEKESDNHHSSDEHDSHELDDVDSEDDPNACALFRDWTLNQRMKLFQPCARQQVAASSGVSSGSATGTAANTTASVRRYQELDYERSLVSAQLDLSARSLKMPWEQGNSRALFGAFRYPFERQMSAALKRPELPSKTVWLQTSPEVQLAERQKFKSAATFPAAVRRLQTISSVEYQDALRRRAISRWYFIISQAPEASATGRVMLQMLSKLRTDKDIHEFLDHVLAKKPPSTLLSRAGPIMKYIAFCKQESLDPFPFEEDKVYAYFEKLFKDPKTAPTKLQSLKQAINFAGFVLQFDGVQEISKSPRIEGMVFKKLLSKRVLFARARWGDHCWISKLEFDVDEDGILFFGYVCGETLHAKTSVSAKQRTMFLPLTAPLWTFLTPMHRKWWDEWLLLRSKFGLKVGQGKIFCPAPMVGGGFCDRPLSAGEATGWLCEILESYGESCNDQSTHGLKATVLAWLAKYGVQPPTRLVLGYHVDPKSSDTLLHYSRDALSGPLQEMNEVIRQIALGNFHPDEPRTKYFTGPLKQAEPPAVKRARLARHAVEGARPVAEPDPGAELPEQEDELANFLGDEDFTAVGQVEVEDFSADGPVQDALDDSNSGSDTSDDSDSVDEDLMLSELGVSQVPKVRAAAGNASDVFYLNKRLSTLHRGNRIDSSKLACGRPITSSVVKMNSSSFSWIECKVCFGTK